MHDEDFDHGHDAEQAEADFQAVAAAIREQEELELLTVGIDIGSSTSHLLFAKVVLRRETRDLSSRFTVIDRQIVWQSPITLTPFRPDGLIDSGELAHFVSQAYADAGLTPDGVDSGAVILTGEAIKRPNARAIDEIFASQSGKFVCATAGHELESILAAHGSGATRLSRLRSASALHVDIGGGTTKLAAIDRGEILGVAAFAVGGRLLAQDGTGTWSRIDDSARAVADDLGITLTPQTAADPAVRQAICERMAGMVVDQILGVPLDALAKRLELTAPLSRGRSPEYLTFSGGVAEYIFGHETAGHGDIAAVLAAEIIKRLRERVPLPAVDAGQRIRATVIGASQFTVQVSGKTVHAADVLPIHNAPVVHLGLVAGDVLDPDQITRRLRERADLRGADLNELVAIAFTWDGPPSYERLRGLAEGLHAAVAGGGAPLVVVIDGDIGQTLGQVLGTDMRLARPLVSIDGVELRDLDYVDVGEQITPPGVIPVVIKSLLFS
jgi:ethanolamine utilization protein EutA